MNIATQDPKCFHLALASEMLPSQLDLEQTQSKCPCFNLIDAWIAYVVNDHNNVWLIKCNLEV